MYRCCSLHSFMLWMCDGTRTENIPSRLKPVVVMTTQNLLSLCWQHSWASRSLRNRTGLQWSLLSPPHDQNRSTSIIGFSVFCHFSIIFGIITTGKKQRVGFPRVFNRVPTSCRNKSIRLRKLQLGLESHLDRDAGRWKSLPGSIPNMQSERYLGKTVSLRCILIYKRGLDSESSKI